MPITNTIDTMLTIKEAIMQRRSTRTFTDRVPDASVIAEVCRGSKYLVPIAPITPGNGRVGTYGIIKGNPSYIAVVAGDEFHAGIEGERAVIELTRRGLATCWLGGTFNRKLVEKSTAIDKDSRIVAVIAVGYASESQSLVEHFMRMSVKASSRLPHDRIVIAGAVPDYLGEALEALRRAPSACNRQSWRLAFNPSGSIDVYGDPSDSFMKIDVGIAVSHFLMMRPDYRLTAPRNTHPKYVALATLSNTYA